jgi:molecular chaperone GrpE (heat shock protein)
MRETGAETSSEATRLEEGSGAAVSVEANAAGSTPARPERGEHAASPEESELLEVLTSIDKRLGESLRLLEHQHALADRLHAENQTLRAGELRSAQLPLVRDLLRLYDDVGRMRQAVADDGDLRIVQESLADTLARNGAVAFEPDNGDEFDPHAHSVAGIEVTAEMGINRTVAGVVKQGFRWDSGEVIRVAEVSVYRFEEPS